MYFLFRVSAIKTDKGKELSEGLVSGQRLLKYYGATISVLKYAQVGARRKQLKFRKLITFDGVEVKQKGSLTRL